MVAVALCSRRGDGVVAVAFWSWRGDGVVETEDGFLGEGVIEEKERFLGDGEEEIPEEEPVADETLVLLEDGRAPLRLLDENGEAPTAPPESPLTTDLTLGVEAAEGVLGLLGAAAAAP